MALSIAADYQQTDRQGDRIASYLLVLVRTGSCCKKLGSYYPQLGKQVTGIG